MFSDIILLQLPEERQCLLGLLDDVVGVDAKEFEGVCQGYGLVRVTNRGFDVCPPPVFEVFIKRSFCCSNVLYTQNSP